MHVLYVCIPRDTDQKWALTGADGRLVKSVAEDKSREGLVRLVEGFSPIVVPPSRLFLCVSVPPSLCGLTFGTGEH
jgi:hypothetical protein